MTYQEILQLATERAALPETATATEWGCYYALRNAFELFCAGMLPETEWAAAQQRMAVRFSIQHSKETQLLEGCRNQLEAAKRAGQGCKALLEATTPTADPWALLLMAADVICAERGEQGNSLRPALEARRRGEQPLATRAAPSAAKRRRRAG